MIGPENTHTCREPPFEAAIYNLKTEGEIREKFKANSEMEMTIELEGTAGQQEKKQERSYLELPVDFSKEDVVKLQFSVSHNSLDFSPFACRTVFL